MRREWRILPVSLNEFIMGLVGVVLGLGIADLLTSLHKLLRAGNRVQWDWLTLAYAALMLFALLVFWWWQFDYPQSPTLTIAQFLDSFIFLAISFLMVASALPDDVPDEGIDLRQFYLATLRHRWGLIAISLAISDIRGMIEHTIYGQWSIEVVGMLAITLPSTVLALMAIRIRAIWFQALAIGYIFSVAMWFNLFRPIGG